MLVVVERMPTIFRNLDGEWSQSAKVFERQFLLVSVREHLESFESL